MGRYLVTGSASGIGQSVAQALKAEGHQVIGVDLREAEIIADLATAEGRAALVVEAERLSGGVLDGVVAAAGLSRADIADVTLAVNYFGAVATLEGLRPLLARAERGRAVVLCSTAALLGGDEDVVAACLDGDEALAQTRLTANPWTVYMTSKLALARWLRRTAVQPEWAGAGLLLNAVAPGVVKTPMTAPLLADENMLAMVAQANPMAVKDYAEPAEIAESILHLLMLKGHYVVGQILYSDGGTDAIMRPDTL
ncbi:MAG: SDR family oxidoreductase [Candidatus Brevundimonas phytovorans]|nr:SDR family oxidoreductase [Brevundimonas sp.]WEK56778.1 MAG: SDR family oxidoreductase [Brevundimonas sp.]